MQHMTRFKISYRTYVQPEELQRGTILTDIAQKHWRIGSPMGERNSAGVYSATRYDSDDDDATDATDASEDRDDYNADNVVVKCEPHDNGHMYFEGHFYICNAKPADIEKFMEKHSLAVLGMPRKLGAGYIAVNDVWHRFIVMPRFDEDLARLYAENMGRFPEATVYRMALQLLDVLQYIHSTGYVHGNLHACNIFLGHGSDQVYLTNFGLARRYLIGKYFPDLGKKYPGTLEYMSRDAHQGVATRCGDLEMLGYNLLDWLGAPLPWVRTALLQQPLRVFKSKRKFMGKPGKSLNKLFPLGRPKALYKYMKYVAELDYTDEPDYDRCRRFFIRRLREMQVAHIGALDLKMPPEPSTHQAALNLQPTEWISPAAEDDDIEIADDSVVIPANTSTKKRSASPTAGGSPNGNAQKRPALDLGDNQLA